MSSEMCTDLLKIIEVISLKNVAQEGSLLRVKKWVLLYSNEIYFLDKNNSSLKSFEKFKKKENSNQHKAQILRKVNELYNIRSWNRGNLYKLLSVLCIYYPGDNSTEDFQLFMLNYYIT